jgi:hypothetical protein
MRRCLALCALAALCLVSGCFVQSVHPLYDAGDTLFDDGLVGAWTSPKHNDRWEFSSTDGLHYNLAYTDEKGHTAKLAARLTMVGGTQFMDLTEGQPDDDANVLGVLCSAPVHTLWKLRRDGDALWLSVAGMKWLSDYLAAHPGELAFEYAGDPGEQDWPLVTASTDDLRAFVGKHMNDDGWFDADGDDNKLTRLPAAPAS